MRGQIIKRSSKKGSDSWSIVISMGKDEDGKYKKVWHTFHGTSKQAEEECTRLLHQKDTGTYIKPGKTTLAEYLNNWLKDYCEPNLSPNSTQAYRHMVVDHITPAIGRIPLTKLKPEHLQRLYSEKLASNRHDGKGKLSNRTVQYIHTTLHKSLKHALKMGLIIRNPADAVDPPKIQKHEIQTLNETEVHLFLEFARATPYYALFYTALFTGMRRSELLGLRWGDLDLILCQLSVSRTLHHLENGQTLIKQPKTSKGKRTVALTPSTALVLSEYRSQQEIERQKVGLPLTDDDYVFSQYDGKPLLPDSVTHAWMVLARRCGFNGISLHAARHTHASLMLKQGIHPKIVQERLGHASIQITLDTYSHVVPGLQEAAAKSFDQLLVRKENPATIQIT